MIYDTVYAHQDKFDDAKVGIKSTALLFGSQTRPVLLAFTAALAALLATAIVLATPPDAMMSSPALPQAQGEVQPVRSARDVAAQLTSGDADVRGHAWAVVLREHTFGLAGAAVAVARIAHGVCTTNLDSRAACWTTFNSHTRIAALLWAALAIDYARSWWAHAERASASAPASASAEVVVAQ